MRLEACQGPGIERGGWVDQVAAALPVGAWSCVGRGAVVQVLVLLARCFCFWQANACRTGLLEQ